MPLHAVAEPGRRPAPKPGAPLAIASLDTLWSVEILGETRGLRALLAAAARGGSGPPGLRRGRVCLRIGSHAASFAPGNRLTGRGVVCAATTLAVRLSLDGLSGEAHAAGPEDAPRALDVFFRAAAMLRAGDGDWVCLHASSALSASSGRLYVFAGPSEVGKTTCARAFGARQVVDDDFVVLRSARGGFERLACLPPWKRRRLRLRHVAGACPVAAIVFPGRAERFTLRRLRGADALRRCLHLPAVLPGRSAGRVLEAVHRLVEAVPIFQMGWRIGQKLPQLLDDAITL